MRGWGCSVTSLSRRTSLLPILCNCGRANVSFQGQQGFGQIEGRYSVWGKVPAGMEKLFFLLCIGVLGDKNKSKDDILLANELV